MTSGNDDPAGRSWHLDKRLPVALIVALLAQAASSLWWASGFSARTETRLEAAERRLSVSEDVSRKLADAHQQLATQVAINAATQQTLATLATKLEAKIDAIGRIPPAGGAR